MTANSVVSVGGTPKIKRLEQGIVRIAPWLLGLSLAIRLLGSIPFTQTLFVDLHVYVLGGRALAHPGSLYSLTYTDLHGQQLPFIYPPFAALLFYPLHWFPFPVVAWIWQAASVACLYLLVRISQHMVGGGRHRVAMLWTAIGIWFEPVRNALDFSQVGVFLTLAVLYAAYTSRSWLSGLLIGIAAGLKVTPAITGVYLVGMRRWMAALASIVTFLGTIGLSALVLPEDTKHYFVELFSGAEHFGSLGFVFNQSLQGALSRIVGRDVGHSPLLLGAIAVTGALAVLAWRALGSGFQRDALGSLMVVELFGLMASPISWAHHWVWVVPLLIWLYHGPCSEKPGAFALRWIWFVLMVIGVPTFLSLYPQDPAQFSRPWFMAWGEAIYVPMTLVTLVWIIAAGRARRAD